MKYYVASSLQNKAAVIYVQEHLTKHGCTLTYDWTKNERATSIEALRTIGQLEKQAIIDSDFLVLLLPGGKGSHTELGMALALDKPVYIYSEDEFDLESTTTFYYIDGTNRFSGTIDSFLDFIIKERGK